MFAAFLLLILLITASPAIPFADGVVTRGIVALTAAMSLGIVATEIREGESEHLGKLVRPVMALMALPAIWILIQIAPMPIGSLSHPIWTGAAEALDERLWGHISVDLGATLLGLIGYLTASGVLLVAAAVTVDRVRAEGVLQWLAAATAVSAVILLMDKFAMFAGPEARAGLYTATALGVVTATAVTIKAIERYETRRNNAEVSVATFAKSLGAGLAALAMCWLALLIAAPLPVSFAAGCGFATIAIVVVIRRLALPALAAGALASVAIVAAFAIAAASSNETSASATLRFAANAAPSTLSMAERMIADNLVGTGIGTFKVLVATYQGTTGEEAPTTAPTAAAQVTIEMGRLALGAGILMAIVMAGYFLRGALRRGRDSFYATAAAGCIVTLTAEAFADAGPLGTASQILAATIFGLGLAQSVSRTVAPTG